MKNVTFEVPPFLQHLTDGKKRMNLSGNTVGECLDRFIEQFPKTRVLLFDQEGNLFRHIDIYRNGLSTFPQELSSPVNDGDILSMLYLVDGG